MSIAPFTRPIASNPLNPLGPRPLAVSINEPVSYAHNFRVRLFNADPEQQRARQMVKDNYRKELQKQMEADKERKQHEKRKLEEEDMKYEREFYEKVKIEAKTGQQKREEQPYIVVRSRERIRGKKKVGLPQEVNNPETAQKEAVMGLPTNPSPFAYPFPIPYKNPAQPQFPRLIVNRSVRDSNQRVLNEYSYEDQRLSSIHYFQQAILRKMDSLKTQIKVTRIDGSRQIARIRHLLQDQNHFISIQYADDMDLYQFNKRKQNVMQNRSFTYKPRSNKTSKLRHNSQQVDDQQLFDHVELLPPVHQKQRSKRLSSPLN